MSEYQKDEHDMPPLTRKKRLMLYFFPLRLLYSPLRLVFTLVLCIFTVEFLIMVGLQNILRLTPIIEYFLDAFLLSVILCPVFIVLLLRPLKHLIAQYQLSENQLRGHKEHLAQEVKARTSALVSAVQQLKAEIIERDRVKEALRVNTDLLEAIIESISCPLYYNDGQGRYLGCNKAFSTYLGLSKEQIIGSTLFDVVPVEPATRYRRADLELMESSDTQTYEAQVRYADGTLHDIVFNKSAILHRDGLVGGVVGVMQDITKLKQTEREKDKLTQSLLYSQEIESIGRLAAGVVTQDFNNLLTPILCYAEMLRESSSTSDERTTKRIHGILEAATKARDLNCQLLAFDRKQLLEMKLLDLNQVIESFNSILSRTIRGDISITLKLEPALGSIMADKVQVEQILMNLAINAQDAMPDGGELIFETSSLTLSQSPAGNFNLKPGAYVLLTVSDKGCGMDAEIVNHIFKPFYTTREVRYGTGLGLATVFGIVDQHGGSINVYSEPGYVTTFRLYFPRLDERPPDESRAEETGKRTNQQGRTILIVEDNPMVREVTREVLEDYGYKVLAADGAEQATMLLRNHGKPVDLLLSDVNIPGMNGLALYEVLKALQADLKVLYMSGYSENIISLQGMDEGSSNYIRKPFTPQELLSKVDKLLGLNSADSKT